MPSPSRRRGYLDRELRRNDTVKSGECANNAYGRVTDATGRIDGTVPSPSRPRGNDLLPAPRVETNFASPKGHWIAHATDAGQTVDRRAAQRGVEL